MRWELAHNGEAWSKVNGTYADIVGHDADQAFIAGWRDSLANGKNVSDLRVAVAYSGDAAAAINGAWIAATGVAVTTWNMSFWQGKFVEGASLQFLRSALAYGYQPTVDAISSVWLQTASRQPSPNELVFSKILIAIGVGLSAVQSAAASGLDLSSAVGSSIFTSRVSLQDAGVQFAGPGAPVEDPRIVATQDLIMLATAAVMQRVDAQKMITDSNRAVAGTMIHKMLADEIKSLNLPGVSVEQSFINGDVVSYGADGSVRTDVILRDTNSINGIPIAVWDFKTGRATSTPTSRIAAIVKGLFGANPPDIPVKVIKIDLDRIP